MDSIHFLIMMNAGFPKASSIHKTLFYYLSFFLLLFCGGTSDISG